MDQTAPAVGCMAKFMACSEGKRSWLRVVLASSPSTVYITQMYRNSGTVARRRGKMLNRSPMSVPYRRALLTPIHSQCDSMFTHVDVRGSALCSP
jgi:hypothetical protein